MREQIGTRGARWTRARVLSGGAVLAGGAVAAACAAPGAPPAAAPSAREVTISYVTDWSGGARGEWVKAAVPRFTAENPKIQVRVDNWGGEVTVVATANAAAGTLQDVMLGSNDIFIQLVRAGGMQDIAPVLRTLKVSMDDLISVPSTILYGGKQYGLPFQFGPIAMVLNKTLFRNAGAELPDERTTYPQLVDALRKVARPAENVYGFLSAAAFTVWLPFVWGWGGDRWTPDLKRSTIGDPAAVEGLQFYVDLMHRSHVATPIDAAGKTPQGVSFAAGNVAVAASTAPGKGMDREIAGKFEWDVMYHLIAPKTGKRNVFINDQANTVTATAAKNGVFEQAVRFVAWCSASKTAQDLVVEVGPNAMPVYKPVLNGPAYTAGPPAGQKIVPAQASAFRDPQIFIGWNDWRDDVVKALTPAFANQVAVQEAAREAARVGDLVLAKIPR